MTNDEKIAIALKSDYLSELSVYEMPKKHGNMPL